ncbi:MAG: TrpR like protein, YerC/YecD [Rhodospirillales bacterium]|nr:TrpR like protein, YerC/YecD [Alphaproteobacteria bacterium]MCB9986617.1 TrpR like protein, YerC/YecD [Rhodospirillales bacterium]USO06853.1 MAG: TrpR like protein, YerC/YecD [Rhodospirillales bacterium]
MAPGSTTRPAASGDETHEARFAALCRAFLTLKSEDEIRRFLIDLCTPGEMRDFGERFLIARLLHAGGRSYREISAITGASTTTVGRVARFLEQEPHRGYKAALERMK